MLVLSRKKSESIQIGPDIVVTVVDIRGGKVRIGIQAPKEVSVVRSELVTSISTTETESNHESKTSRKIRRDGGNNQEVYEPII